MPKGVYPRRPRTAKPAKRLAAAKPAAPKPDARAALTARASLPLIEFIDTDPAVVRFEDERDTLATRCTDLQTHLDTAIHKFTSLERAISILSDKVTDYEISDDEDDKIIRNYTGEYLECIASGLADICTDLRQTNVIRAAQIASLGNDLSTAKQQRGIAQEKYVESRKAAREQWESLQQANTATETK